MHGHWLVLHALNPTPAGTPRLQIESIFNPVRGPRDAQLRAGIKPVNHARANAVAVREQSQINALRKASDTSSGSGAVTKLPPGEARPGQTNQCSWQKHAARLCLCHNR